MIWANNGTEVPEEAKRWMKCQKKPVMVKAFQVTEPILINTLEGQMTANGGDYVIMGVQGECYPCKPDIFHKTYHVIA